MIISKVSAKRVAGTTLKNIVTWQWTKALLHWIIISAGTMAECVFLVASLWMSINSSVHPFVLHFMNERTTIFLSEIATAAYVALPECILGLAFVVSVKHIRMCLYNRRDFGSYIWSLLYGLPTIVFLILSLITLGCSVTSSEFIMPMPLVVIRALAAYVFAFTSLLYAQLGAPQEHNRLQEKDDLIANIRRESEANAEILRQEKDAIAQTLNAEIARIQQTLGAQITRIQSELDAVYKEKETAIAEKSMLHSALTQSSDDALQAYGESVIEWVNGLDKTVDIDDIALRTGINKRRLQTAIDRGELRVRGTNKSRIWVPSLRDYLVKNAPKSALKERDTGPILHVVNR